jgi:hypothetical protein
MDLFVVPAIGFTLPYGFVIIRLDRRDVVWVSVTTNPAADWMARQITEAFPWNETPRYMNRDPDRIYGAVVTRRLRAMGIRDKPVAAASPWQNGFAERLIASIRRERLNHVIVLGEAHHPLLSRSPRGRRPQWIKSETSNGRRAPCSKSEIGSVAARSNLGPAD